MMNKIYALTFLGLRGACGSAAFLNKFPEAKLIIGSANTFNEKLSIFLNKTKCEIYIIGLGPGKLTNETVSLLNTILKKGNQITWFIHFKSEFITKLKYDCKNINSIYRPDEKLSKTIINFFKNNNPHTLRIKDFEDYKKTKNYVYKLVEQAKFRYFNYDNREFYPEYIRKIAQTGYNFDSTHFTDFNSDFYMDKFLFGKTKEVRQLKRNIEKIGQDSICNVLIEGESGTGKTTIAYSLHFASNRLKNKFKVISCANFQENLLDSELFGHEKGAFTGASQEKKGVFETFDGGTVFLDEIGELPFHLQSKLLLVLQDGIISKIGSSKKQLKVDVRIISATNKNLEKMVENGKFRNDLYYRLAGIKLNSIPLRKQIDYIEYFAEFILKKIAHKRGKNLEHIDNKIFKKLREYHFPGNVRELENILERAFILDNWDFSYLNKKEAYSDKIYDFLKNDEFSTIAQLNQNYSRMVYNKSGRNKTKTAKILGVSLNTLKKYLRQ
ncbi:MAG: sigma 54-interacting transcriptional regulator [Candidatus Muiribacteriota bacterium]